MDQSYIDAMLEIEKRRREDQQLYSQEAQQRQEEQRAQGIQSQLDRSQLFSELAPLDEQESENERKRAIIEEMRGESTRPLQGQRAGRVYVAPSPFEGLAQLTQAYIARKGGQKAYAKEEELADRRMEKIKAYEDTLRGRLPEDMGRTRGARGTPLPMRRPRPGPLLPVDPDDDEELDFISRLV
tara:strand:- start:668 stop:1219 length:552 start_codon:yes stop_codon:yes gene_type:complete